MTNHKPEVDLDDPKYYPLKDCWDREVTEPEDLNSEILIWEITPNLEGETTVIRSRQEALDYMKEVVELNFEPNSDGRTAEIEEYQVTMRLVSMTLGDYIAMEGN